MRHFEDIWLVMLAAIGIICSSQSLRGFFKILSRMETKTAKEFDNYYLPLQVVFT